MISSGIEAGDGRGLLVAGRRLELLPAARVLRAGLTTELFGAATGTFVTCLAHGNQLLDLSAPAEGLIQISGPLGGLWWPGLDTVARSWVGNLPILPDGPEPGDITNWTVDPSQVTRATRRWCERVLDAGPGVFSSLLLTEDTAWLKAARTPFASRLLTDLTEAATQGQRRLDGTWAQDSDALARI